MPEKSVGSSPDSQTGANSNHQARVDARQLWAELSAAHAELNSQARRNANQPISNLQKQGLQCLFKEVHRLVEAHNIVFSCALLDQHEQMSAGEALMLVGQHRAAVRIYRVEILGEDPFSF